MLFCRAVSPEMVLVERDRLGAVESTEPETARFAAVAPPLVCVMVPEAFPADAPALMRANNCAPKLPVMSLLNVNVLAKVDPPSLLTSKFAGAVTVTELVRLLPVRA